MRNYIFTEAERKSIKAYLGGGPRDDVGTLDKLGAVTLKRARVAQGRLDVDIDLLRDFIMEADRHVK